MLFPLLFPQTSPGSFMVLLKVTIPMKLPLTTQF